MSAALAEVVPITDSIDGGSQEGEDSIDGGSQEGEDSHRPSKRIMYRREIRAPRHLVAV